MSSAENASVCFLLRFRVIMESECGLGNPNLFLGLLISLMVGGVGRRILFCIVESLVVPSIASVLSMAVVLVVVWMGV